MHEVDLEQVSVKWKHYRAIHSKWPTIDLFEMDNEDDQLLLMELEGATAARLDRWRDVLSENEYQSGPGWSSVMAAFCYGGTGRFSTDSLRAYYCAEHIHTAIAEWSHHCAIAWADFGFSDDADAIVRVYQGEFKSDLIDLRHDEQAHHLESYQYSQNIAQELRNNGALGVIYHSTRHVTNKRFNCAALFSPLATTPVIQAAHYTVKWNGRAFVEYAKVGKFKAL
jgi:hypothetical protein